MEAKTGKKKKRGKEKKENEKKMREEKRSTAHCLEIGSSKKILRVVEFKRNQR